MPESTQQTSNSGGMVRPGGPVAAHPVVAIEILDGRVLVNGEELENPGGQEPHEAAIHHVARQVATTLGRPVRARATDANGTMGLVVHPDGQVSDLEELTTHHTDDETGGLGDEVEEPPAALDDLLAPDPGPAEPIGVEPVAGDPTGTDPAGTEASGGEVQRGWPQGWAADPIAVSQEAPGAADRASVGVGPRWPLFAEEQTPRPHLNGHDARREPSTSETAPVREGGRRRADTTPPASRAVPAAGGPVEAPAGAVGPVGAPSETPARARTSERVGREEQETGDQGHSFLTRHQTQQVAQSGWRGALTRMGISTAPSERERSEREDVYAISRHWPGPRMVAVVNPKGGATKTPTTVVLSALFARHGGSGVLAWDNNETRGTLGWRTEQGPHESHVRTMLPHTERLMLPTARSADLAAFVHHQTEDKFDVLRSNPRMLAAEQRITAADFDAIHQVVSKYYRLAFVDSGNDESAPHWLRMIDHADQIVVATTTRPDHAEAGRLMLDALRERDEHSARLADQAVVVVSQADREEASADEIASGYAGRVRAAVTIPYDRSLRAPWLRFGGLAQPTQRAYLRAAAAVSEGL